VKVLGVLKCIAFGCSGVAFRDYHQMGRNTTTECIKAFFSAILADPELRGTYLRSPTRADAKRITGLHKEKHGVDGMLGSLDCMHVLWKNCPVGEQAQYKNAKKNKMSSVVIEAAVDWNTWFWHTSCGHPGTNNDINIWDKSELQQQFLSGFHDVDFEFELDGQKFNKLWYLVDGIYPTLARFVKTIPVPIDEVMRIFAKWQESARKDSERAFGVLVRKFQFLAKAIEFWYIEDIKDQLYGCILLHNMMVEVRVQRQEREDASMYAMRSNSNESVQEIYDEEDDDEEDGDDFETRREKSLRNFVQRNMGLERNIDMVEILKARWKDLYDSTSHVALQTAVMNAVAKNYIDYAEE
jgi:hypothetical protein